MKQEWRHFKNICVLLGCFAGIISLLGTSLSADNPHCSIIFYLSESCHYYSVFPLICCLKIPFACRLCSLHVEHHSSISPTIKLCGEESPSDVSSQLDCSLPLWNIGFFGTFTRACHWCCLYPVQPFMFFKFHFNVILSAARSRRMVYYPHSLWLHFCTHFFYSHVRYISYLSNLLWFIHPNNITQSMKLLLCNCLNAHITSPLVQIVFTVPYSQTQHQQHMSHPHEMISNINTCFHHYIYICTIMSQHLSSSAFKVPIYISVVSQSCFIAVSVKSSNIFIVFKVLSLS